MCNIEFTHDIPLLPFGFPIININIKLKVRRLLAITSHFMKFKRKTRFSFSHFLEDVYVMYVNEQKINKSNKRNLHFHYLEKYKVMYHCLIYYYSK